MNRDTQAETADSAKATGRAAALTSLATLVSRVFGFARNISLTFAIGTSLVADAYNVANNVPNTIFLLLGGGTIAAVFLPRLAGFGAVTKKADEYGTLLLGGAVVLGSVLTGALVLTAPTLVSALGSSSWTAEQKDLAAQFTYWCAPQVLLLSIYAVLSQIANAREKFASVAWLSSASSIMVIVACIPLGVANINPDLPGLFDRSSVVLLGGATLIGTGAQVGLLCFVVYRIGFRMRIPPALTGYSLRSTAKTGAWTILSAAAFQFANLTTAVVTARGGAESGQEGRGYSAYLYAQTLLYFGQAVLTAGLSAVLLQRLSIFFSRGDLDRGRRVFSDALFKVSTLLIPLTVCGAILGPFVGVTVFARGSTSIENAIVIGVTFSIFCLGLLPFTLHTIVIRPFYAQHDALTPLRSAIRISSTWSVLSVVAYMFSPAEIRIYSIAAAFVIAYSLDLPLKLWALHRRRMLGEPISQLIRRLTPATVGSVFGGVMSGLAAASLIYLWGISYLNAIVIIVGGATAFLVGYWVMTRRTECSISSIVSWVRR